MLELLKIIELCLFKRLRATAGQGPNYVGPSCGYVGLCWPMLAYLAGTAKHHCKTQYILMVGGVGGLSWGYVGPSWGYVGASWGYVGPSWGLCWPILGLCWPILRPMLAHVDPS